MGEMTWSACNAMNRMGARTPHSRRVSFRKYLSRYCRARDRYGAASLYTSHAPHPRRVTPKLAMIHRARAGRSHIIFVSESQSVTPSRRRGHCRPTIVREPWSAARWSSVTRGVQNTSVVVWWATTWALATVRCPAVTADAVGLEAHVSTEFGGAVRIGLRGDHTLFPQRRAPHPRARARCRVRRRGEHGRGRARLDSPAGVRDASRDRSQGRSGERDPRRS